MIRPGSVAALQKGIPWLFSVQKYVWFVKELQEPDAPVEAQIPVELRIHETIPAGEDWGAQRIRDIRGERLVRKSIKRWANGAAMVAAYHSGTLAAYKWIHQKHGAAPRANEGWAHTYDAWTFDEYRGKKIMPVVEQALFNYCRTRFKDVTHIDALVHVSNVSSFRSHQTAGYRPQGHSLRVRLVGRVFAFPLASSTKRSI